MNSVSNVGILNIFFLKQCSINFHAAPLSQWKLLPYNLEGWQLFIVHMFASLLHSIFSSPCYNNLIKYLTWRHPIRKIISPETVFTFASTHCWIVFLLDTDVSTVFKHSKSFCKVSFSPSYKLLLRWTSKSVTYRKPTVVKQVFQQEDK